MEIASNKKATLDLVTFFITKNKIKKGTQSVPPATNSGSQWGSNSSNSRITQNKPTVNNHSMQGKLKNSKNSNQAKLTTNINPTMDDDIRYSQRDYSYEALTSKADMKITVIDDSVKYKPTPTIRKNIVNQAIKNAISIGKTNENGNAVVYVKDIESDVILGVKGLRHGLDRRLEVNTPVTLNAGAILQNAIRVNELVPEKENITNSYVLIGAAKNKKNEPYIVQFVVNRATNEVTSVDVLYSVNAKTKKNQPGAYPQRLQN